MTRWMARDWTQGDLNALLKKVGGDRIGRGILDNTVEFTVTARVREFLRPAGEFTLPAATELFDPHVYFRSRKGLWVLNGFTETVLLVAQPTSGSAETTISSFDLVKPANDAEIRSELPKDHVFGDPSEFCATLAQMINRQPTGRKGDFLFYDYWNIFYVQVGSEFYAVRVRWDYTDRVWDVDANPLDGDPRGEGLQVLSATA